MHSLKKSRAICSNGEPGEPQRRRSATPRRLAWTGALLLAAWGLAGCSSIIVPRAGDEDQYHSNWWNFYRRGLAALDRQAYGEARAAFETCLGLRPGARFGYDNEAWRVRTYGVHFLNGYFPNRELGICLFNLQETPQAIEYLEKSLRLEPSGRAKHYLNQAQARQLQAQILAPPRITFTREGALAWTRARHESVTGLAAGDGRIAHVAIAGEPEFIELAELQQPFQKTVPLSAGTNWITVTARDLKGQQGQARLGWIADWQPPELAITRFERQGADWLVHGFCQDDFGVKSITTDGRPYAPTTNRARVPQVPVTLRLAGGRPLRFEAQDLAGNRLQTVLTPPTEDALARLGASPRLAAATAGRTDAGAGLLPATSVDDEPGPDVQAPDLVLGAAAPLVKVCDEEFFLDGRATDRSGLASLTLNNRELIAPAQQGTLQRCFAQRLPLAAGTNTFTIVARDQAGNRATQQVVVVRQEPEYLNESFRLSLVLPPLPSDDPGPRMELVRQELEAEVLKTPPRFHLLERGAGWDAILEELQLGVSDLADPRAALRLGRVLSADLLLQSVWLRQAEGRTLYARMVDFSTGETLFDTDVYTEQDGDLARGIAGLIMKIEQRFPLVQGTIVKLRGSEATIDAGATQGLTPQTRLIACAAPGPHAEAGLVRRLDGRWVELKVRGVEDARGRVEIVPSAARQALREGDHVYAR